MIQFEDANLSPERGPERAIVLHGTGFESMSPERFKAVARHLSGLMDVRAELVEWPLASDKVDEVLPDPDEDIRHQVANLQPFSVFFQPDAKGNRSRHSIYPATDYVKEVTARSPDIIQEKHVRNIVRAFGSVLMNGPYPKTFKDETNEQAQEKAMFAFHRVWPDGGGRAGIFGGVTFLKPDQLYPDNSGEDWFKRYNKMGPDYAKALARFAVAVTQPTILETSNA